MRSSYFYPSQRATNPDFLAFPITIGFGLFSLLSTSRPLVGRFDMSNLRGGAGVELRFFYFYPSQGQKNRYFLAFPIKVRPIGLIFSGHSRTCLPLRWCGV